MEFFPFFIELTFPGSFLLTAHHQIFFWKISENRIKRLEYKPENFKFTFIPNVTV